MFVAAVATLYVTVTAKSPWNAMSVVTTEIVRRVAICT